MASPEAERQRAHKRRLNCESQSTESLENQALSTGERHPKVDVLACTFSGAKATAKFTTSGPVFGDPVFKDSIESSLTQLVRTTRQGLQPKPFVMLDPDEAAQSVSILHQKGLLATANVQDSIKALRGLTSECFSS